MTDKEKQALVAFQRAFADQEHFGQNTLLVTGQEFLVWLEKHFPADGKVKQHFSGMDSILSHASFAGRIAELVGDAGVGVPAYRAFLSICRNAGLRMPAFNDTDLQEYLDLYALSLRVGNLWLGEKADEVAFLECCYKEELLAAREDQDRLYHDRGRIRGILSTFSYFLWIFGPAHPDNLTSWEAGHKKVQERMDLLRENGRKRGNLFDNPVHVWRLENLP